MNKTMIAAAAVINEIIAVIFAKKGFEWAGELESQNEIETTENYIRLAILTDIK